MSLMTDADFQAFYASDLAGEVRREYLSRVDHGVMIADATRDVLAIFADLLADPQEGPVIFLALAALQVQDGRVLAFIRDAALDLIGTGEAKRAYATAEPTVQKQRRLLLRGLEEALESVPVIGS
jgi:hypothetical protein